MEETDMHTIIAKRIIITPAEVCAKYYESTLTEYSTNFLLNLNAYFRMIF
jgi:hypothetical protein